MEGHQTVIQDQLKTGVSYLAGQIMFLLNVILNLALLCVVFCTVGDDLRIRPEYRPSSAAYHTCCSWPTLKGVSLSRVLDLLLAKENPMLHSRLSCTTKAMDQEHVLYWTQNDNPLAYLAQSCK